MNGFAKADLAEESVWHKSCAIKGLTLYPFKGKGQVAARMVNLQQGVDLLKEAMGKLVDATRSVRHKTFALCVVRSNGAEKLLWRLGTVRNGPRRVFLDDDFQALLGQQTKVMRDWYGDINQQALVLNMQSLNVRREMRLLERLLLQIERDAEVLS